MSFRLPPKLRGSSREAVWQNKMRDVVASLRPVVSRNIKFAHTTRGVVNEGRTSAIEGGSGGAAVWL